MVVSPVSPCFSSQHKLQGRPLCWSSKKTSICQTVKSSAMGSHKWPMTLLKHAIGRGPKIKWTRRESEIFNLYALSSSYMTYCSVHLKKFVITTGIDEVQVHFLDVLGLLRTKVLSEDNVNLVSLCAFRPVRRGCSWLFSSKSQRLSVCPLSTRYLKHRHQHWLKTCTR